MSEGKKSYTAKVCARAMRKIKDDIPKDCEVVLIIHCHERRDLTIKALHKKTTLFDSINQSVKGWVSKMMKKSGFFFTGDSAHLKLLKMILAKKNAAKKAKSIWEKRMKGLL